MRFDRFKPIFLSLIFRNQRFRQYYLSLMGATITEVFYTMGDVCKSKFGQLCHSLRTDYMHPHTHIFISIAIQMCFYRLYFLSLSWLNTIHSRNDLPKHSIFIVFSMFLFIFNSVGGNLLSLHSKEESDMLLSFVRYVRRSIYIGLIRRLGRGKCLFVCSMYFI